MLFYWAPTLESANLNVSGASSAGGANSDLEQKQKFPRAWKPPQKKDSVGSILGHQRRRRHAHTQVCSYCAPTSTQPDEKFERGVLINWIISSVCRLLVTCRHGLWKQHGHILMVYGPTLLRFHRYTLSNKRAPALHINHARGATMRGPKATNFLGRRPTTKLALLLSLARLRWRRRTSVCGSDWFNLVKVINWAERHLSLMERWPTACWYFKWCHL